MLYRVMVVDSSNFDLRHYSTMSVFEECGFDIVSHTSDPECAVASALHHECDMLLCLNRPSGVIAVDLLKRCLRAGVNIPTIVISKVNASNDMRECFLLGAVDYLIEPAMEEDMRAALQRVIKAIGKKIMSTEYEKAMKTAFNALNAPKGSEGFVEKLRELLVKSGGSALTVEVAADHFGFNPDYFGRYFKSRTGLSFSEFYKRLTMDYARLLIESGHYRIREISDLLGYASADYFTRVFKKVTGQLPSYYKK